MWPPFSGRHPQQNKPYWWLERREQADVEHTEQCSREIEAGDMHEIRNTGRSLLKTVNVYLPPAYDADGEELPPGKP